MSDLNEVGERDGWVCWLCDTPVDPDASVNADLGPSVDSYGAVKGKKGAEAERLAHRACNTMKGKNAPVVAWPKDIVIGDPAAILETVERLQKKGGREVVGRCMDEADADAVASWLVDRLSRLAPSAKFEVQVNPGGGQYMLQLRIN